MSFHCKTCPRLYEREPIHDFIVLGMQFKTAAEPLRSLLKSSNLHVWSDVTIAKGSKIHPS